MVSRSEIARTFFRIGLTAYGGPAIVAQIRRVTVLEKKWVTEGEFQESLAYCQLFPGPIAVQTAAHIGWRLQGAPGAFFALAPYVFPSFLLMLALSFAYFRFGNLPAVGVAFQGLAAVIVAIVADAILGLAQTAWKDWRGVAIATVAACGFFAGVNAVVVLLVAAAAGIALGLSRGPAAGGGPATSPPGDPAPSHERGQRSLGTFAVSAIVAALLALAIVGSGRLSRPLPALGAAMVKTNLLAFGGGYTAIALMFQETVGNPAHAWLTEKEFIDGLALGQITPGPVIITATFIGYRVAGWVGACFATVCVFLPSALILVSLAPQFAKVRRLAAVRSAVGGLLAAFVSMLLHVMAHVAESAFAGPSALAILAVSFVALRRKVGVLWVVLAGVALSLAWPR